MSPSLLAQWKFPRRREIKNCTDITVRFKTKKKIEKVEKSSTGDSGVF